MNTERGPIANAAVCVRRDSNDAHFRIESEDGIANRGTFIRIIHRNEQKIWVSFFHATDDFPLPRHFAHDDDIGLIRKGFYDDLAHEFRAIGNQDSNLTSHGSLLPGSPHYPSRRGVTIRPKKGMPSRTRALRLLGSITD